METYTPGADGRGRSVGIEPPWKSLSVIVLPLTFFFDMVPNRTLISSRFLPVVLRDLSSRNNGEERKEEKRNPANR